MKTVIFTLVTFIYCAVGQNQTSERLSESFTSNKTTLETLEAGDDVASTEQTGDKVPANVTSESALKDTENSTRTTKLSCSCNNTLESSGEAVVQLVNGTTYQTLIYGEHNASVTNRSLSATCSVTLFYAPWCDFSTAAAPHYNALARVFPQLRFYAVDSSENHALNTQFGVMALPSILLFHNSRPIFKYNFTDYTLASFSQFINILTGLEPETVTEPEERDYEGPVPSSPVRTTDFYLVAAALFTLICALWQLSNSEKVQLAVDGLRNLWREVEMHEHND